MCNYTTGDLLWKFRDRRWFANDNAYKGWNKKYALTKAFTAATDNRYLVGNIFGLRHRAHHVIWAMCYGFWPVEVDHIDGDRTNNSLMNLRLVDRQTNSRNASRSKANKSGVTGVHWDRRRQNWKAEITINYRNNFIGNFDNLEDAIAARKTAERNYGFHSGHGKELAC